MEEGLIWAVTSLYGFSLAVGFGARVIPTSPHGIFSATITVVVVGHLVNLHAVGADHYQPLLLITDLLAIVFVSLALGTLVNPLAAGRGSFTTPWHDALPFAKLLREESYGSIYRFLVDAFRVFFCLASFLGLSLVAWHLLVHFTVEGLSLSGRQQGTYSLGWGLYFILVVLSPSE